MYINLKKTKPQKVCSAIMDMTTIERARATSKTQHVHDQQMFLLSTSHKSKFLQGAKK